MCVSLTSLHCPVGEEERGAGEQERRARGKIDGRLGMCFCSIFVEFALMKQKVNIIIIYY